MELIQILEERQFETTGRVMLTSADVNAFVPFYQAGARHDRASMVYEPPNRLHTNFEGFMPQVGALRIDK